MRYNRLIICLLALFSVTAFVPNSASAQAPEPGKSLFKEKCASCHSNKMTSDLTGPALAGVEERWADFPKEDLYNWIRNSQLMVSQGHPRATALWAQWQPTVMNSFNNLTDEEIESLIAYINFQVTNVPDTAGVAGGPTTVNQQGTSPWLIAGLFVVLLLLALVLSRIVGNLDRLNKEKAGIDVGPRKTLGETLTSKRVISFLIFALIVIGGYTTVNNAISLGRQQGYSPEQPIPFSHELHAGTNKIECQYCHDGARRSKHAVIPALNTCMNCHAAVKNAGHENSKTLADSRKQIAKIYAATGYDPLKSKYIEGYDKMDAAEVTTLYSNYLMSFHKDKLKDMSKAEVTRLEKSVAADVKEVVKFAKKPVEWVRIHNLPDHVYFNHSQHVVAGGIACQTCHGEIEKMEKVYQFAPLSMGWCVNCHRETEVQFADNDYYKSYEKYHEELKNGDRKKVTVEDIGGLECQKCHY